MYLADPICKLQSAATRQFLHRATINRYGFNSLGADAVQVGRLSSMQPRHAVLLADVAQAPWALTLSVRHLERVDQIALLAMHARMSLCLPRRMPG
jgi:hypothetical protein